MCLVVAKLQGASFSSLWIISPFLLAASIILCCLGCAIFGITEVSTDGVEFDTGEGMGPTDAAQQGSNYTPPSKTESSPEAELDPEKGSFEESLPPPPEENPAAGTETSQVVDLLDDAEKGQTGGEINELD